MCFYFQCFLYVLVYGVYYYGPYSTVCIARTTLACILHSNGFAVMILCYPFGGSCALFVYANARGKPTNAFEFDVPSGDLIYADEWMNDIEPGILSSTIFTVPSYTMTIFNRIILPYVINKNSDSVEFYGFCIRRN